MHIPPAALRRVLAVAGAVLTLALVVQAHRLAPAEDVIALTPIRFSARVDDEQPKWVSLPHAWRDQCSDCETAWYRAELWLGEQPQETWALYLPAFSMNAAVYLNGRLLGQGGRFADPTARLHERPLYVEIPRDAWRREQNALQILLKADPSGSGSLAAAYAGPHTTLHPYMEFRELLRSVGMQVVSLAALSVGLVFALVWINRRTEHAYGWFSIACIAWAVYLMDVFVRNVPVPTSVWVGLNHVALGALAWSLLQLMAPLSGANWRRVVSHLWLLPASAICVELIAGAFGSAHTVWLLAAFGTLIATGFATAIVCWRCGRTRDAWRVAAGAVLAGFAAADAIRLLGFGFPQQQSLLGYAAPLVVGALTWMLLKDFVDSLRIAERLNVSLDLAVRQKTSEIEQQFERIRRLEKEHVLIEERERLMRDMHDGMGGQLVSALAMAEQGGGDPGVLAETLRRALDEMRLIIDSLEPVDENLNSVLAMFRERAEPRLRVAGVALHWRVEDLPPVTGLGPVRTLHILRILQEAITNTLKHARAVNITLVAKAYGLDAADQAITIEIIDDGAGFEPGANPGGRGLRNLQHRAHSIGADVQIVSAPCAGTRVCLRLQSGAALESARSPALG